MVNFRKVFRVLRNKDFRNRLVEQFPNSKNGQNIPNRL